MLKTIFSDDFPSQHTGEIELCTRDTLEMLRQYHPFDDIEVRYDAMYAENPQLKVSAASDDGRCIEIRVNTYQLDHRELIDITLPNTLTHEFHHFIRWRYVKEFHLAELMVLEGLAEHFLIEVRHTTPPPYIRPVTNEKISSLAPLIRRDLYNPEFEMRLWQRGDASRGVPYAFGYSLGFKLVGEYLSRHPGRLASNCFDLDCREITESLLIPLLS